MSSRFIKTLLLAAVIVGGIWILVNRDQIRQPSDVVNVLKGNLGGTFAGGASQSGSKGWGLPSYQSQPWNSGYAGPASQVGSAGQSVHQPQFVTDVIRIGSFRLNPQITTGSIDGSIDLIADICRRYDVIAFQEVSSEDNSWLAQLTDRMNAMGATGTTGVGAAAGQKTKGTRTDYSFISDREHNPGFGTQSAILFNRATVEIDQSQWYTVNDPNGLLSRKPIVGCFRAKGPAPDQALTFTLANMKIDPQRSKEELAQLAELFRAIRNDGRGEDDVLIVGDFNAGDAGLQPVRKMAGLTWVVSNRPTDTKRRGQFDNLIFSDAATVEFTGRGGVFDFMRFYNLRLDDALAISEHSPVWAEFSIFEGRAAPAPVVQGKPGRVAGGELEMNGPDSDRTR